MGQVHDHLRGLDRIARLGVVSLLRPLADRTRGAGVVLDRRLGRDEAAFVEEVRAERARLDRVTWMPSGASSRPRLSLRPSTANFAEQ
jgi:hypothetical protein